MLFCIDMAARGIEAERFAVGFGRDLGQQLRVAKDMIRRFTVEKNPVRVNEGIMVLTQGMTTTETSTYLLGSRCAASGSGSQLRNRGRGVVVAALGWWDAVAGCILSNRTMCLVMAFDFAESTGDGGKERIIRGTQEKYFASS